MKSEEDVASEKDVHLDDLQLLHHLHLAAIVKSRPFKTHPSHSSICLFLYLFHIFSSNLK